MIKLPVPDLELIARAARANQTVYEAWQENQHLFSETVSALQRILASCAKGGGLRGLEEGQQHTNNSGAWYSFSAHRPCRVNVDSGRLEDVKDPEDIILVWSSLPDLLQQHVKWCEEKVAAAQARRAQLASAYRAIEVLDMLVCKPPSARAQELLRRVCEGDAELVDALEAAEDVDAIEKLVKDQTQAWMKQFDVICFGNVAWAIRLSDCSILWYSSVDSSLCVRRTAIGLDYELDCTVDERDAILAAIDIEAWPTVRDITERILARTAQCS